jgi:hypothetical protein
MHVIVACSRLPLCKWPPSVTVFLYLLQFCLGTRNCFLGTVTSQCVRKFGCSARTIEHEYGLIGGCLCLRSVLPLSIKRFGIVWLIAQGKRLTYAGNGTWSGDFLVPIDASRLSSLWPPWNNQSMKLQRNVRVLKAVLQYNVQLSHLAKNLFSDSRIVNTDRQAGMTKVIYAFFFSVLRLGFAKNMWTERETWMCCVVTSVTKKLTHEVGWISRSVCCNSFESLFTELKLLRLVAVKTYSVSLLLRVVYISVADLYTPVTTQNLKLRSSPLYGAGKRVDETTTCPNTVGVGRRMFLPCFHHWRFGSVLHQPVLQFFFNEKRYYVNLWLQLYYFFYSDSTAILVSLCVYQQSDLFGFFN